MSLQYKIREQLKIAMQEKNQVALDSLRAILAACINEAVSLGKTPQDELNDTEVQNVVKRLIKQRRDSIEQFKSGGREDLIIDEQAQISILKQFQPEQISKDKIFDIAKKIKEDINFSDKNKSGILVGMIMKELQGKADGTLVKEVVDELFS